MGTDAATLILRWASADTDTDTAAGRAVDPSHAADARGPALRPAPALTSPFVAVTFILGAPDSLTLVSVPPHVRARKTRLDLSLARRS